MVIPQQPQGAMELDDGGKRLRREPSCAKENASGGALGDTVHRGKLGDAQPPARGVQRAYDVAAERRHFKVALGITLADKPHQAAGKLLLSDAGTQRAAMSGH